METARFGIQVSLVEPGDHRGGGQKCRLHAEAMSEVSPYSQDYADTIAVIAHDEGHGSDPAALGRKVARMLTKKRMPFRKRIASMDQHLAVYLHDALPPSLNEIILKSYYFKKKKGNK